MVDVTYFLTLSAGGSVLICVGPYEISLIFSQIPFSVFFQIIIFFCLF